MNNDFELLRQTLKVATVQRPGDSRPDSVDVVVPEAMAALNRIERKMIRLRGENMGLLSAAGQPVQVHLTVNAKKVKDLRVDRAEKPEPING